MKNLILVILLLVPIFSLAEDLAGDSTWNGEYTSPDNRPPVSFDLMLHVNIDGSLSGHIKEPNPSRKNHDKYVSAKVIGSINGSKISFVKTYDKSLGKSSLITYKGTIAGNSISGIWQVGKFNGTFSAILTSRSTSDVADNNVVKSAPTKSLKTPVPVAKSHAAVATQPLRPSASSTTSCDFAVWEGIVKNLADLFACDEIRAIASLSRGRQVEFRVGSVSFKNDKLYVAQRAETTLIQIARKDLDKSYSANKFFTVTRAANYDFTCIFPLEHAADVRVGEVAIIKAKLISYSRTSGQFECS